MASSSCACRLADDGRAFVTLAAAADTVDLTLPEEAGLKVSFWISPRSLLSDGRSAGTEMGPAASDTPRCGVTASSDDGEESRDSRLTPFVLAGVAAASSAGRKRTLIFFSWIDDLAVCSICAH